jgi:sugar phosphate isomerase/epimerase
MNLIGVHSNLLHGPAPAVAQELRRHGLACVELTPGFPGLRFEAPVDIAPSRCRQAAEPFIEAGLAVAAVRCTADLTDPDLGRRHAGIVRCHALIRHCRDFGTPDLVIEAHRPQPSAPGEGGGPAPRAETFAELLVILRQAARLASDHGVSLHLRPGPGRYPTSIQEAGRMLEEVRQPSLKFVMDPASFLAAARPESLTQEVRRLCEQLAPSCPLAHAKDLRFTNGELSTPRLGQGVLDYREFFRLYRPVQPDAPVILEHVRPEELEDTRAYLERLLG